MNHYSGNDPALGCGLMLVYFWVLVALVVALLLGVRLP